MRFRHVGVDYALNSILNVEPCGQVFPKLHENERMSSGDPQKATPVRFELTRAMHNRSPQARQVAGDPVNHSGKVP